MTEENLKDLAKQISDLSDNPLYKNLVQNEELQNHINKDLIERVKVLEAEVQKLKEKLK